MPFGYVPCQTFHDTELTPFSMIFFRLISLVPLSACFPDPSASLLSSVTDAEGLPIADVQVEILDLDTLSFSTTETDENGNFLATLPPLQTFFAVLKHPEFMTTAHTGFAGEGETNSEESLQIQSLLDFQSRQSSYTDCSESGGYIEGEVRVAIPEQELDALPIVTTLGSKPC